MSWLMDWQPTTPPQRPPFNPYSDPYYVPGGWPASPSDIPDERALRKRKFEEDLKSNHSLKRACRFLGYEFANDTPQDLYEHENWHRLEAERKARIPRPWAFLEEAMKRSVPAPRHYPPPKIIPLECMSPSQKALLLDMTNLRGEKLYPNGEHKNSPWNTRQPPIIADAPFGIAEAYSESNSKSQSQSSPYASMKPSQTPADTKKTIAAREKRAKWKAFRVLPVAQPRLPTPEPEDVPEPVIEKSYATNIFHNIPKLVPSTEHDMMTPEHQPIVERSEEVADLRPFDGPWSINTSSPHFEISSDSEISSIVDASPVIQASSGIETIPAMEDLSMMESTFFKDREFSPSRQLYQELNAALEVTKIESEPDTPVVDPGTIETASNHIRETNDPAPHDASVVSTHTPRPIGYTSPLSGQTTWSTSSKDVPEATTSRANTTPKTPAQQLRTPMSDISSTVQSSIGNAAASELRRMRLQLSSSPTTAITNGSTSVGDTSEARLSQLAITDELPTKIITPKAGSHASEKLRRITRQRAIKEQALQEALNQYEIVPLTQEWEEKVKMAVRQGSDKYSASDLARVVPQYASRGQDNWLNDEAINGYLDLVVAHGKKNDRETQTPSHHAFNSFFYSNLSKKGPESVSRWSKRAKIAGKDLLKVEKVFIPINAGAHWTLAVVEGTKKTITHYNSMRSASAGVYICDNVKKWVAMELGKDFKEEDWTILTVGESPQQTNSDDCGVFTVTSARQIMLGFTPSSYKASQIQTQRKRIVAELVAGQLLRSKEKVVN